MEVLAVIIACGCATGLLLAARLVSLRMENAITGWSLAGFIFCLCSYALDQAAYQAGWFDHFPHLWAVANPFIFLLFPCLYFYVASIATPEIRWRPRQLLHFAAPLLIALMELPTYLLSGSQKAALAREQLQQAHGSSEADLVTLLFIDSYGLIYLALSWRTFFAGSRQRSTEADEEGLSQVRRLRRFLLLVSLILILGNVMDFTPWGFETGFAISVVATLCAFWALWELINPRLLLVLPTQDSAGTEQSERPLLQAPPAELAAKELAPMPQEAPSPQTPPAVESPADEDPSAKAREMVWQDGELKLLRQRLERLLQEDKAFLDPQLSLPKLAAKAATSRHKMSAALKTLYGQNFYQLIGSLRVRAAAKMMLSSEGMGRNLSDIAFSVGFNSLSTFNSAFKAEFAQTPSKYLAEKAVKRATRASA
jgi:AraC-like DNA-binding protein